MRRQFAALFGLALMAGGCNGSANRPLTQDDERRIGLSDVGELYRLYTAEKHKAPNGLADFAYLAPVNPMGLRALESGEIVVRLGATLQSTEEGPSQDPDDEILAYQKDVPITGGEVLMLNRTVRTMTPEEFKTAKLAGNKSSDAESPKRSPRSS